MNKSDELNKLFGEMFGNLKGFGGETKADVTNKYIQGLINKDEFMKRMKKAKG